MGRPNTVMEAVAQSQKLRHDLEFYPSFDQQDLKVENNSRQDKFKTDFTLSIFDTSKKLQIQREREGRKQETLEKNKKNSDYFRKTPSQAYQDGLSSLLSAKQQLHFSPKSSKLTQQPLLFDFDLYIRAAQEIQRHFRGHLSRTKQGGSFFAIRASLIRLQRAIRRFLHIRAQENLKYLEYLDSKSKKLLLDFKNFYKIYRKVVKSSDERVPSSEQKWTPA